ncbi:hypothetical protein ACLOJK_002286 [Asimina triloba]
MQIKPFHNTDKEVEAEICGCRTIYSGIDAVKNITAIATPKWAESVGIGEFEIGEISSFEEAKGTQRCAPVICGNASKRGRFGVRTVTWVPQRSDGDPAVRVSLAVKLDARGLLLCLTV